MKLFIILLLLSFSVNAGLCQYTWNRPIERMDETPLPISEIDYYQIWINGELENMSGIGQAESIGWFQFGACPEYTDIQLVTVDTQGRHSIKSPIIYPPNEPALCQ